MTARYRIDAHATAWRAIECDHALSVLAILRERIEAAGR
jgi:hypothetical protein